VATDLTEAIADAALEPKKVEGDAGSIETRPISDMIAADKYAKGQTAVKKPLGGLRLTKVIPPGSV
jgi:hypothetical protein